ncbi:MAG: oligopeptide ABC transporter substrate-binding protein [Furfurilactobacillus sp.]|jgi:peptide/nickel transport system substrate-binding protein|uniref:Oligopeptide ABC transporter substrate-binding protein n=1 Tax=Furfurilactobacillus milii TaxID=2888272 RepID=A0ABT6DBR8_9LACO|nr:MULTISPECIES: oligopeptide ABC transporter substrate-binding protein [Furfurilactobacillus]QLE67226.1 Oligopeptide ABC transporter periplasmic oligopeptide-binding protein OppA [Furfurilactobacillus rossiae]MCF6161082.1 oligopeptide ABC transporter substrate-binding protein [Furfurilactobacillus milii]MCF6163428.1 oligopeptide ABC transporter substrate-binding protein [Furfurilactobacillus milii]MCF6418770.1 oligopeptide ABC transporter substrate-binding protein [Furfurilactobacillus milii]
MKKSKLALAGVAALSVVTLAACSNGSSSSSQPTTAVKMPQSYSGSGKIDQNGTIKAAEVNDAPFKGLTDEALISNAEDSDVFGPGLQGLFNTDKNYNYKDGGPANIKLSRAAKTLTITLRSNLKWSDGSPVTAKDVEYAYEVLGNKDSTSQQFSANLEKIKGMTAYHQGKSSTISGIEMPNGEKGKKVVIHYTAVNPSMTHSGNGFVWEYAEPYEHIKNVPIKKLASSSEERKTPLFYGPYKLKKVVEGESTSWVRNPYYWGKKANAKAVTINVVSTSAAASAFKSHKYDFTVGIQGIANSQYPNVKKLSDYTNVGTPQLGYGYLGFMVGHMDSKTGSNVMDKSSKVANKSLRQAMAYAMNTDAVEKKFGNGLGKRATTLIPSGFSQYHDKSAKGYPLNIKKANKLLDDAGYKKKGKWRQTPDGKKLVLHFAAMKSGTTHEQTIQNYLQQWHKIGLDVQLTGGKTMEMNAFYDAIQAPKPPKNVDFFEAAWSTGTEPTPTMYTADAPFNMGHFVSKENTDLINNINNQKAFKDSYRKTQFNKWQEYMNQQAAYVPESETLTWTPVNHRVKNFTYSPAHNNTAWAEYGVTSSNPK